MADGLQPTYDISGNNNGVGQWGGSLIGGAVGGAVGAGWNRNNNNGERNGDHFVMDTLTTMRTDLNSIGRDQLMQAANNAMTACQGFGGINATVQGVAADIALGQARTEAAILTTGYQGQLEAKNNTFQIVTSQKDCCCQTQQLIREEGCANRAAIHAEGEATRGLITNNVIQELRDRNAHLENELAQARAREFAVSQSQTTQTNIIAAVRAMLDTRVGTGTTTGGATT